MYPARTMASRNTSRETVREGGLNLERLNAWLDICNVTDPEYRAGLIAMSESTGKGWWTEFRHDVIPHALDLAEAEASAASLDSYETLLIPGLLQTKAYSEVIHGYNERKVEFRHRRQKLLTSADAPSLRAVIHEAALHTMYGGPTVMRDQLNHLIEMSQLPNVTIQILPFDCTTYAYNDTTFMLIRAPHTRLHTVLLESPTGSRSSVTPSPSQRLTRSSIGSGVWHFRPCPLPHRRRPPPIVTHWA
ncbi:MULTISPECIES: DUF5753 domain-containing protein [Streptomyces]|uniref:DUF5753 domain-containing protein n=1 Tax=Streptomyces TaxID=1883 RepID=UPI0012FED48A|nr:MULTISPECIES: DUF5753 domain-containing protein [Streptomyces]